MGLMASARRAGTRDATAATARSSAETSQNYQRIAGPYLIRRDDVVWLFVKDSTTPRELERFLFALATLFIAFGAGICTWARAYRRSESTETVGPCRYPRHPRHLGEIFYAMGLGSLAPGLGFIILVGGEGIRLFRLIRRQDDRARNFLHHPSPALKPLAPAIAKKLDPIWRRAFRQEAVKWGLLLAMIVFVITLKDRLAEVLACASFLVGLVFDAPIFGHSEGIDRSN
jgi:hypothetical protein